MAPANLLSRLQGLTAPDREDIRALYMRPAMTLNESRTVTFKGPHIVTFPNGDVRTTEMIAAYYDDWQDTPFGRINFGLAVFGPTRWVDAPRSTI